MIVFKLNGAEYRMPRNCTVYDLIVRKKWLLVPKIVRVNGNEIPSGDWNSTKLESGYEVGIIPQFGGG